MIKISIIPIILFAISIMIFVFVLVLLVLGIYFQKNKYKTIDNELVILEEIVFIHTEEDITFQPQAPDKK